MTELAGTPDMKTYIWQRWYALSTILPPRVQQEPLIPRVRGYIDGRTWTVVWHSLMHLRCRLFHPQQVKPMGEGRDKFRWCRRHGHPTRRP